MPEIKNKEILDIKQGNIDTIKNMHKMGFNILTLLLSKDIDRAKTQTRNLVNYMSDELDMRIDDIKIEASLSDQTEDTSN